MRQRGTLTLTGLDSFSNYRAALRTVMFSNTFDAPAPPNRTITATITDSTSLVSNSVSRTVQITKIDGPPVLAGVESIAQIFKLNDPLTPPPFVSSSITVADNDSPQLKGATVQITGSYISTQDTLTLGISNPKITATWDASKGLLTLTGTGHRRKLSGGFAISYLQQLEHNAEPDDANDHVPSDRYHECREWQGDSRHADSDNQHRSRLGNQ